MSKSREAALGIVAGVLIGAAVACVPQSQAPTPVPLKRISPPTDHRYAFLPGQCFGPQSVRCIVWLSPSLNAYAVGPYRPELGGPQCDFSPSNGDVYIADYPTWTVQPKTLSNGKPNPGYPQECP